MADDFFLDLDKFRAFSRSLGDAGFDLQDAHQKLAGVLDQYKGCWGDDEIGKGFQKNYYGDSESLQKGAGAAGTGIVETARGSLKAAKNLAELDEDAARKLDGRFKSR
ncbi:hypothetical protein [Kibdelosporangium phytohabitans]|uniref:WXG100 family type VII secretion target n=1 Tax=Kibdelosporangium phytohabitans TaxID=860235 RepID=A0A0N9HY32_9PSEU|nr:hypothetical protein [Kibdelosporangium phytohabitans]ALG10355.1 hypothetical protein AOZ06_28765 [Kibdelosporangium phytohabitans]MBE1461402.1 hypothetical protein [Kibdelosporangium phytohabitans]